MRTHKIIMPYADIVRQEGVMLQRGMNFRIKAHYSIILTSVRKGAPYNDRWDTETGLLEYEGHDEARRGEFDPKLVDQPMTHRGGALTENGKFFQAAQAFMRGEAPPEVVQVYEKIAQGIWCDRGRYELVKASVVFDGRRNVFNFYLQPTHSPQTTEPFIRQSRIISTAVKVEVWKRDQGRCVLCKSDKNLHFDHDVPYSKGGSSITAQNVRLLCAKHNLSKHDKIMCLGPITLGILTFLWRPS